MAAFRKAILDDYYFEMMLDELPIWGYVGELETTGSHTHANATRYYLELLRQYLVRNRAELGKLAPHPATSHQRDAEIERFVASGQSLHSYRLTY